MTETDAIPEHPAAPANATQRFYAWDHLGSVRVVTNETGTAVDKHDFEPYGVEILPSTNTAVASHLYDGQERDENSGLDYMHYRYYGSSMGRFLKPDNVVGNAADPQSWNMYAYVRGNPISFNDPTGHWGGRPTPRYLYEIGGGFWGSTLAQMITLTPDQAYEQFYNFTNPDGPFGFGQTAAMLFSGAGEDFTTSELTGGLGGGIYLTWGTSTGGNDLTEHSIWMPNPNQWVSFGLQVVATLMPMGNPIGGFLTDRLVGPFTSSFWTGHPDLEASAKVLGAGGGLLGSYNIAHEAAGAVAEDQGLVESGALAEASFDYGVMASGLGLASATALGIVFFSGGYILGTAANDYVLTEGARESIGNSELRIAEFFGYTP